MRPLPIAAALLLAAGPSWALFKVVDASGHVTYTDRPPVVEAAGRVAPFRAGPAPAPTGEPALPVELRQAAQRYPVTLFTTVDCVPCDSARQLLLQRGIPFAEKRVATEDDARALDQLGAGRMLPGLGIGPRQLRGLNTAEWISYLEAAGYPRESRLPKDWKPPAAVALAEPRAVPAGAAVQTAGDEPERAAPRRAPPPPPPPSPPPNASKLRF